MTKVNFEWPNTDREEFLKREERLIKHRAHEMIQKGKLDLYEYALYIEKQMSLQELIEIVENQIREEREDESCELRLRAEY